MTRLLPNVRTEQLLDVALKLAATQGFNTVTHDAIAKAAGCSRALVVARLGTMQQVRRSVMRAAVATNTVSVVAEGLAVRDKHALKAGPALRELAAAWVGQA